jgi:exosome complex exonuclease RRP6
MADWRVRPIPTEMLLYARADTHFLLYIYDNLRNALLEMSSRPPSPAPGQDGNAPDLDSVRRRNPQEAMREVLHRSAETALKLYEREGPKPDGSGSGGWATTGKKWLGQGQIDSEAGAIWKALHTWRDNYARDEDESPQ